MKTTSWMLMLLALAGCNGQIGDSASGEPEPETPATVAPERDPVGEATLPAGRRLRRMSAEQFVASLEVATGERWADYEGFAAAMGRADYGADRGEARLPHHLRAPARDVLAELVDEGRVAVLL